MGPSAEPKNDRAPHGVHPKRGVIELNGSINYPNLKIDKTEIKFGAVLNDTTKRVKVKITNPSTIKAAFSWSFVITDKDAKRPGSTSTVVSSRVDPPQAVNAVFDILPTRGFLLPGQSEDYEFVFYGHANHKYKTVAVCEVQGGPEYEVKLEGEASSIQFKLDRTESTSRGAGAAQHRQGQVRVLSTHRGRDAADLHQGHALVLRGDAGGEDQDRGGDLSGGAVNDP
eukprot:CAMPEP_0180264518 /NCGR_PEP_ID=MMETSP0987-20121128/45852_1 /TAXON_ID=697907 /ORGANISM="non described non described, Strain CCMP2293" /LENGTH=226 /DNA_ID=CAMNT_0022234809 /DNA_START=36 /DNA_END=713 /DNA_ORIENTATION=+